MVRITSKKQQKKKRAQTKKQRDFSVESHRFISSMTFDGNTLTTKTQKDNEPVKEVIYTKDQLAQDIPVGNNMVDLYLDGEMPEELQRHHNGSRDNGVFRNVLISPADLGLLPPSAGRLKNRKAGTLHELQTGRRGHRSRYRSRVRE